MPRKSILSGDSQGTERPFLEKRFDNLENIFVDFGGEHELISIAYDTRHRHPVTNNPLLWLAGNDNKKLYVCDSQTLQGVESFNFPETRSSGMSPPQYCYGIAVISDPTDNIICFLSEPGLDNTGCPILFHLRYKPDEPTSSGRLVIENWFYVNTTVSNLFKLSADNIGMTEYRGDLMILGKYNNINTVAMIDRFALPLAVYPTFKAEDQIHGLLHIHDRIYTTMDGTAEPRIGGRFLAKFITPEIDNQAGRMIPLPSIEPFFLSTFKGDLTTYQDRMAACDRDRVFIYKILYFCFIVDDMHNDDIEMGSVLIGDYKVKNVKFKNIADYYQLKDVLIRKGTVDCPGVEVNCPAKEAVDWVKLTTTDPATTASPTIWGDEISFATSKPYLKPDGEDQLWVKVEVPVNYTTLTLSGGGARPVNVDDGPFVIPLEISAKVG